MPDTIESAIKILYEKTAGGEPWLNETNNYITHTFTDNNGVATEVVIMGMMTDSCEKAEFMWNPEKAEIDAAVKLAILNIANDLRLKLNNFNIWNIGPFEYGRLTLQFKNK